MQVVVEFEDLMTEVLKILNSLVETLKNLILELKYAQLRHYFYYYCPLQPLNYSHWNSIMALVYFAVDIIYLCSNHWETKDKANHVHFPANHPHELAAEPHVSVSPHSPE